MDQQMTDGSGAMRVLLRSHVERCLQDLWGSTELHVDDDGDYPFRSGTAACWVSVVEEPAPGVRVFGYGARELRRSADLVREVNELSSRHGFAKVVLVDGIALVSAYLHWSGVNRLSLDQAMRDVGDVAGEIGPLLAAVYGGRTPFASPASADQDTTEEAA